MSSRNYIIPTDSLTFTDQLNYRFNALAAGIVRSFDQKIGKWNMNEIPAADDRTLSVRDVMSFLQKGGWPESLDVREFQAILDAGAALDQWNTAPLAVVGTEYSVFQAIAVPAIGLRAKKLVVWYRVQIDTVPMPVSRLIFRKTVAAGSVMAQFDLEQLATQQRLDGYLSEPQVWDADMPYAINAMARIATAVFARVILGNFVFEPGGTTSV